jgi:hypothetical protein
MCFEINQIDKNVVKPKAGMSFRINKMRFSPKPESGFVRQGPLRSV